jgi:glycosyltransferase involved in cell wall biosynthesis
MKKICFFCGNIDLAGGTERAALAVANGLAERGYEIHILSLTGGRQPFFPVHPLIITHNIFGSKVSARWRYPVVIHRLRGFVTRNNIDVLIDVESILAAFSSLALLGTSVRRICWEHLNYNNDLGTPIRRVARHFAAILADDIVTLTERDKSEWIKRTWLRANICTIYNPLPFKLPDVSPNNDSKLILSVGRMDPVKGFDILLRAWAKVVGSQTDGWRLRIVGDGNERHSLERLVDELEIGDNVELRHATTQIGEHYAAAAFYCLSSRKEGLPMVLIEAQAHGLPAVAFDCETGPREIISHGQTGKLVAAADAEALAAGILELIRNEDERKRYSANARQAAQRFSPECILNHWVALLEA